MWSGQPKESAFKFGLGLIGKFAAEFEMRHQLRMVWERKGLLKMAA
jgi:hypothetical protein